MELFKNDKNALTEEGIYMRKAMQPIDKRTEIIGIKVKKSVKEKIKFISEREARTMSTQIKTILEQYIEEYFRSNNINWEEYIEEENNQ